MDASLGIPYVRDIAIGVISIPGIILISGVKISLPVGFIIDHPVFRPACHGLSGNPLFFVIRINQVACACKIRDSEEIAGIVISKADALAVRIPYRRKTLVLIQQAYFISCLIRNLCDISVLISK